MLPNFLIIGAARSGTTAVYHNLTEHPDIFMPLKKEINFYSFYWDKGLDWYERLFEQYDGQKAIGEASVSYTYPNHPDTPSRIAGVTPDTRLIYIVRNPIERTFSHYLLYRFHLLYETRDFSEALEANPLYLGSSLYYDWIERYLTYFPRENLKVVLFEDYKANPELFLKQIFNFLDIDDTFVPKSLNVRTNASYKPRNQWVQILSKRILESRYRPFMERMLPNSFRPVMRNRVRALLGSKEGLPVISPGARAHLSTQLQPDIEQLSAYLDRDLSSWK